MRRFTVTVPGGRVRPHFGGQRFAHLDGFDIVHRDGLDLEFTVIASEAAAGAAGLGAAVERDVAVLRIMPPMLAARVSVST